ncbi:MAG: hypothetical protein A2X48_13025 [Lentisphaerae bacterium GWF2_49_21]|nr:MAG: hypothetical protein A2X48_13025 [Lentisphaerae bacterium GWF2_49_21]
MFGITQKEPAKPFEEKFFAHATSIDLLNPQWETQEFIFYADYDNWGETHVWAPHIIAQNNQFFMFYCAGGDDDANYKIHLAVSDDLWEWRRHEANPMVSDGYHARDPMILKDGDNWIMYYTATKSSYGGNHTVAAVTSDNLITWRGKREVFIHPQKGTCGGPTESPFVITKDGKYYLFVCTNNPYSNTAVYESDVPFHWEIENQVGSIPAHAAEIIHTESNRYYISRAGWGEGGLYLADLLWHAESNTIIMDDAAKSLVTNKRI